MKRQWTAQRARGTLDVGAILSAMKNKAFEFLPSKQYPTFFLGYGYTALRKNHPQMFLPDLCSNYTRSNVSSHTNDSSAIHPGEVDYISDDSSSVSSKVDKPCCIKWSYSRLLHRTPFLHHSRARTPCLRISYHVIFYWADYCFRVPAWRGPSFFMQSNGKRQHARIALDILCVRWFRRVVCWYVVGIWRTGTGAPWQTFSTSYC